MKAIKKAPDIMVHPVIPFFACITKRSHNDRPYPTLKEQNRSHS